MTSLDYFMVPQGGATAFSQLQVLNVLSKTVPGGQKL
jgi:hypothetical protein